MTNERTPREIIDDFREIVKPRIAKMLLDANYEGLGKSDKAEFETEFEVILTLADMALKRPLVTSTGQTEKKSKQMNTPEEEITYGIMNKKGHVSCLWSKSYAEALDYAKTEQPMNRPYYILERTEHYEIVGEVKDNATFQKGGK